MGLHMALHAMRWSVVATLTHSVHSRIALVPLLRNQDTQTNCLCTPDLKPERTSCQDSIPVRPSKVSMHACMITASNCMLAVHKAHVHDLLSRCACHCRSKMSCCCQAFWVSTSSVVGQSVNAFMQLCRPNNALWRTWA